MNLDRFIEFLQQVITMTNPDDELSVGVGKNIINNLYMLANNSEKVDYMTLRVMSVAECNFDRLMSMKDEFAGKPGDVIKNREKRFRLKLFLKPGC